MRVRWSWFDSRAGCKARADGMQEERTRGSNYKCDCIRANTGIGGEDLREVSK